MPKPPDDTNNEPDPASHASHDLDHLLAEVKQLTRPEEMPRRVELCRAALAQLQRESQPYIRSISTPSAANSTS